MTSIIVAFHLLVPKLRPVAVQHGFVSPGDWVRHRFGDDPGARKLVLGVALLMSLALANFLFAQLKAMGELGAEVTGGIVPYEAGVIGFAAVVLFYETRGGMRAVAWTDTAQGLLMLFGLMALLSWLLAGSGAWERSPDRSPRSDRRPSSFPMLTRCGTGSAPSCYSVWRVSSTHRRSSASMRRGAAGRSSERSR